MFTVSNDEALRATERSAYDDLYGNSSVSRKTRSAATAGFKDLFPAGHKQSAKPLFQDLAEKAALRETFEFPFHRITNVHPRAWELILRYGRDYVPSSSLNNMFAKQKRQPAESWCFVNSYEFMKSVRFEKPTARVSYVEGFTVGPVLYPMLHAWNGFGFSKHAIDWTCYARSRWCRYFGIPFTCEEYEEIMRHANPTKDEDMMAITLLFRVDNFERTERYIREVLEKRSRKRHPRVLATSIT